VRDLSKNSEVIEEKGFKTVIWNCDNDRGRKVTRGVYLVVITDSAGTVRIGKVCFTS